MSNTFKRTRQNTPRVIRNEKRVMIAAMSAYNPDTFTQKDLMYHLLQVAQHTVTREELQSVKIDLKADIQEVRNDLHAVRDELKVNIQEQGKKHDRLSWAIFAGMLAIFFKDHLTKLLM